MHTRVSEMSYPSNSIYPPLPQKSVCISITINAVFPARKSPLYGHRYGADLTYFSDIVRSPLLSPLPPGRGQGEGKLREALTHSGILWHSRPRLCSAEGGSSSHLLAQVPHAVAFPNSPGAPAKLRLAEHETIMINNVNTYGAASNR